RAKKGLGVRGGPNNAPTNYFYQAGFFTPFGPSWGAPFAPTASCAPAPTKTPKTPKTPVPKHSHKPASPALLLAPMGLWGLIGKLRVRRGRRVAAGSRRSKR
ncbi:MAG TPA: hypothetical protein VF293_05025, partial [Candidatus Limnocylindrales bacterium]